MRMNVKQQRLQSVGLYQVNKSKVIFEYIFQNFHYFEIDLEKAVVKKEFKYKKCCNDEKGM